MKRQGILSVLFVSFFYAHFSAVGENWLKKRLGESLLYKNKHWLAKKVDLSLTEAAAKKTARYVATNFDALAAAGLANIAKNLKEQREQEEYKKKIVAHLPYDAVNFESLLSSFQKFGVLNMQLKKDYPIDFKEKMIQSMLAQKGGALAQRRFSFFDRGVEQYRAKYRNSIALEKLNQKIAALEIEEEQERNIVRLKAKHEYELRQQRKRQTDEEMQLLRKKIRERTERNLEQKRKQQEKWRRKGFL